MTPKEKSIELHAQFMKPVDGLHKYPMCFDTAKQCALITVEELITCTQPEYALDYKYPSESFRTREFWEEVKKEIENKL